MASIMHILTITEARFVVEMSRYAEAVRDLCQASLQSTKSIDSAVERTDMVAQAILELVGDAESTSPSREWVQNNIPIQATLSHGLKLHIVSSYRELIPTLQSYDAKRHSNILEKLDLCIPLFKT